MLSFSSPEVVLLAVRRDQQGGGEVPQQVGVVLQLVSGDISDTCQECYMFALVCRDDGQVEELGLTLVGDGDVVQVHLEPHPQHVQPHHGDKGRRDASF